MSHHTQIHTAADAPVAVAVSEVETTAMLDRLDAVLVQLGRLIECRPHESLQQPGHDGRWGVVEILCHLRDWELVVHDRVARLVAGDRPHLEDPDTSMWPLEHDYGAQDSLEVFAKLVAMRRALIERLRSLGPDAWARVGVLDGHGELSLHGFLEQVVAHDDRYVAEARDAVA